MIIDCHVHIHPEADGWGDRYDASLDTLMDALRQGPVDKAVLLPIAPKVSNDFIYKACKSYPDQLIGFASVEPNDPQRSVIELEHAVFNLGLKGLKLHPRLQGFGINDFQNILPLIQKSALLNIPVLIDGFIYGSNMFELKVLELINRLACSVPEAKIILAHAGGFQLFDALMIAKSTYNVYLDISFTPQYFRGSSIIKDLGFVIKKLGVDRIIYGSDHPEMPLLTTFSETLDILQQYGLTSSQIDAILGENIQGLIP